MCQGSAIATEWWRNAAGAQCGCIPGDLKWPGHIDAGLPRADRLIHYALTHARPGYNDVYVIRTSADLKVLSAFKLILKVTTASTPGAV